MMAAARVTTGFQGLDDILDGLRIGDNVVWKVDSIDDYRDFVGPFVESALKDGRKVVYMRFGQHAPLLEEIEGVRTCELDPRQGFEHFATRIHAIITEEGKETFYVFDCLSELLSAWATDHMIGNFFRVTCPYLFELDTVAYFALIRDRHAFKTIARIRETTQVLLDVHNCAGDMYIHPLKVWQRNSPTMFLPHLRDGDVFTPLANSYDATNLLTDIHRRDSVSASRQLDHWHRLFLQAEELDRSASAEDEQKAMVGHLCHHLIGREERMLSLAREHLSLEDLLNIKSRMVGTGFIGGKTVGMLLARRILEKDHQLDWQTLLETHDSFFVGSNVYYAYIVHNGWWKLYMRQKTEEGYFEAAAELKEKMLHGTFPEMVATGFRQMLEYFGQYPIIVRSSSLLEDSFGSAFAGKYDSFFCASQGSLEQRYEAFADAVRKIFASTMSEDALTYRIQRGLDKHDEQMALLVQRVSGAYRKHYYFPELAGVGVSHNTFVWDKDMDPKAGMLRLVYGLGTRAVDRVEGDYPRIVALDAPLKKPHKGFEDTRRFAQRDIDLINLEDNAVQTVSILSLANDGLDLRLERFGIKDRETMQKLAARGRKGQEVWLLTFDELLSDEGFTGLLRNMLKTIETAYGYPVDVEFTVNFATDGSPKINVLQCRPLQTKGQRKKVQIPERVEEKNVLIRSEGNFMGGNISQPLKWVIWVDPEEYTRLALSQKYEVARLVGRLNKRIADRQKSPTMLLGPGRWGTSTPNLGVPVTFSEISNITALGEVAFSAGGLMPELSYGSHFFQDLVEADIFYLAVFPENKSCHFNEKWLKSLPNSLEPLMPASSHFKNVVKAYRVEEERLLLVADVVTQALLCYRGGAPLPEQN
ncbi:PEP/pyruvate-binding domain-containing protein [uncultured Desulfuromonas sp.]|uniref:PEP/pyruvate-binding domain-containing protein n=1 Tax=uncultured Desulfuromonas sp. TaxID=181013 RepID=UPI0026341DDE|nr:PEP/pyruvate-binding domain-containing protein [uncultured Desulfuromonas sp.]